MGDTEGLVHVSGNGEGPYGQLVRAGRHTINADEPEPTGNDGGPTPYDLLLGALGTCTAMTVRMYAQRKGWALDDVQVSLRHDRIYAQDCANCETEAGMVSRITRELRIIGDLDEEQRDRLRAIADRCPVHRTLRGEITIETEMV